MKRMAAMLLFPRESLSEQVFDQIKREGYTDVLVFMGGELGYHAIQPQCFSIEEGAEVDRLAGERELGLILSTDYLKDKTRTTDLKGPSPGSEPEHPFVLDPPETPLRFICPFHPANLDVFFGYVEMFCRWKTVRDILVNDEARLSLGLDRGIGCFCAFCRNDFKQKYGAEPPVERDAESQLWWDWTQYRMARWTEVHARIREKIKAIRPDVRVGRNHNAYDFVFAEHPVRTGVDLVQEARTMDVVSSNAYPGIHCWQFAGDYMPARRYTTEAIRLLCGVALDKPANIRTQGFMPGSSSVMEMTRRDGVMAGSIPYCLGAETATVFTYELMQAIPGFVDGFSEAIRLRPCFEQAEPYAFATMLCPLQTEVYGYPLQEWGKTYLRAWVNTMYYLGLPWQWLADGRMEEGWLDRSRVLIVPDAHCLTAEQLQAVREFVERGGAVLWVGETPDGNWDGEGYCPPKRETLERECAISLCGDGHPVLSGIASPVVLSRAISGPGLEGEVLATFDGHPVLVVKEYDKGREAWLSGMPLYDTGDPRFFSQVRLQTDGLRLLRNLLCWLSSALPTVELDPYPPLNPYGRLRPWDRRDRPTMEMFPLVGERLIVVVLFTYIGCACETNLVVRVPEADHCDVTVEEVVGERNITAEVEQSSGEVRIPIRIAGEEIWRVYTVAW